MCATAFVLKDKGNFEIHMRQFSVIQSELVTATTHVGEIVEVQRTDGESYRRTEGRSDGLGLACQVGDSPTTNVVPRPAVTMPKAFHGRRIKCTLDMNAHAPSLRQHARNTEASLSLGWTVHDIQYIQFVNGRYSRAVSSNDCGGTEPSCSCRQMCL